jgi:hypothetical protein
MRTEPLLRQRILHVALACRRKAPLQPHGDHPAPAASACVTGRGRLGRKMGSPDLEPTMSTEGRDTATRRSRVRHCRPYRRCCWRSRASSCKSRTSPPPSSSIRDSAMPPPQACYTTVPKLSSSASKKRGLAPSCCCPSSSS